MAKNPPHPVPPLLCHRAGCDPVCPLPTDRLKVRFKRASATRSESSAQPSVHFAKLSPKEEKWKKTFTLNRRKVLLRHHATVFGSMIYTLASQNLVWLVGMESAGWRWLVLREEKVGDLDGEIAKVGK